jgi:hypothetical protein
MNKQRQFTLTGNKSRVEEMKNPYNVYFSMHLIHSFTRKMDAISSFEISEHLITINFRNAKEYHHFNIRVIASCESGKSNWVLQYVGNLIAE